MSEFEGLFGRSPEVECDAAGRVNLIGEHTDYNGGFVLPTAIPQRTFVNLAPRADSTIRVWSSAKAKRSGMATYTIGKEQPRKDWLDYVQGVTRILQDDGNTLRGFDAYINSTVPLGSGLSSSASLTVGLMRALRSAFGLNLDDVQIAKLGQRVENEFVGARVGIMDPMAASLATEGIALFLDARSLDFERVPLPRGADLVVIHSGVVHRLAGGDYNTRRGECEQACVLLGVQQLRDLSAADLPRINDLPEPLNRRARHVVTENDRVLAAVTAIRNSDLPRLGELFYTSHDSMRDDCQVSVPEIDLLVKLARAEPDIYGARLTGGGFGGSVVLLAREGQAYRMAKKVSRAYASRSGLRPRILVPAMTKS
jgi:galactokinase